MSEKVTKALEAIADTEKILTFYQTMVGTALMVLQGLKPLVEAGDERSIEAVMKLADGLKDSAPSAVLKSILNKAEAENG